MGMLCVDRKPLKTLRFILMWAVIMFLPQPQHCLERKKNPPACSPFIIAFVMLVRYTPFFWKDLFNYSRHRARWPPVPISKYNLKSKCYWALLNWLKKQMFMIHINVSIMQNCHLLMKQLCEKIVLWKGLMFFTCLDSHIPKRQEGLKEAFPNQTVCHKKLFPTLHDLLGNSLIGTVVSYKIQNEKTVTAKWSLWNCHPFNINCI